MTRPAKYDFRFTFRFLELMVLIVVLALGFTWLRFSLAALPWSVIWPGGGLRTQVIDLLNPSTLVGGHAYVLMILSHALPPILATCTLVFLAWSLIHRRPSLRRFRRRAGFLLCTAIVASLAVILSPFVFNENLYSNYFQNMFVNYFQNMFLIHYVDFSRVNPSCGRTLLGGCLALACLGRIRLDRSRLEYLALSLASLWLVSFLAWEVCWFLSLAR